MILFWPILASKYEVPKLNTPKYVTLQKLTAKIEHCINIFLYLYSLVERKMAKISHTKIKQLSFGEKRPKISRFTVVGLLTF
jgi:hypothetical protein